MDKLNSAKAKLLLEHPFFGSIATNLKLRINNNIFAINYRGDTLEYNSEYLEALKIEEIETILATAAMKQALFHQERSRDKIESIWNQASEYAINSILVENGFVMHPLAKYNESYNGLYAEEIYHLLLNDYDPPKEEDKEQKEQLLEDSDYTLLLEQIIQKIENQDELPKGVERVLKSTKKNQISWRELLYRYINNHAKIDYKMFPSNKKHLYRGVALPSINSDELKIAIAIDTCKISNTTK